MPSALLTPPVTTQRVLPQAYMSLSDEEAVARIPAVRRRLGSAVMILGHHYQRDDVIRFADATGDSYGLARQAAGNRSARFIVFLGVHFMAESADILTGDDQVVILPDADAGCSMADMADLDQVEDAWDDIEAVIGAGKMMPVTYINSAADLKAFVGRHGGAVCTSSNAEAIIRWSFRHRERLFFFPDQHLGRNTCVKMGLPLDEMVVWDPRVAAGGLGGNQRDALERARVILWRGHCQVHQRFLPEHVKSFRAAFPGIRILVHPECSYEVVQMADLVGSTSFIIKTIESAPPGSKWAVGTEIHLVDRLRKSHPEQFISSLVPGVCLCSTMNRTDPQHLLWVLESLDDGRVVNQVKVPGPVARDARLALDRMLSIS